MTLQDIQRALEVIQYKPKEEDRALLDAMADKWREQAQEVAQAIQEAQDTGESESVSVR